MQTSEEVFSFFLVDVVRTASKDTFFLQIQIFIEMGFRKSVQQKTQKTHEI